MMYFHVQAVLLDIEGTTSSLHFVHEVLFPYARRRLSEFLSRRGTDPDVVAACTAIAREAGASLETWSPHAAARVEEEVHRLMDGDVKATGLKQLQGLIWEEGFRAGELRSHVYDDVPQALVRWQSAGLDVRIYSSGSVQAQQLFFAHTTHGNLLPYFHGHYDTTIGPKKDSASYHAIATDMGKEPATILFLSDVPAELDAAGTVGMKTVCTLRPGNAPLPGPIAHPTIHDFSELELRP